MEVTTIGASGSKALRCLLAALIALSSVIGSLAVSGQSAFAAETASLSIGGKIPYAGYTTTWMYADGEMAYCGNPSAATPPAGTYTKSAINSTSGRDAETIADLWFSYGSPGFDASLWPGTWYDGTAMTDARYAALAHILLSDTFSSNGSYALYGCNESFKEWCRYYVIGFDSSGTMCNDDATGRKISRMQGEVPSNFEAFMLYTGAGNQLILSFKYTPYGKIDLKKVTANEEMCEGNPLYSVEGAVYTVYSNSGLTDVAGSITTDRDGYGILEELEPGSYWVKETKQAPGHALDPTVYPVEVRSDETTRVNGKTVSDIPQSDPVGMLVGKVDADTNESEPEGDATLEGALFTARYYAGDYADAASAEASGAPARTWVFETDADGFAYLADEYKHSGDPLYYQTNGDASIPLGTVLIQETRAPQGYNLDDGHGRDPKVFCVRITQGGAVGESVYTYNSPKVPDTVKRGDFRLVKEVPVEIYDSPSGDMPQEVVRVLVPGVKFELYNDSESAVLSPESGKLVEPGNRVCTITVNENGLATTKDDNANVNGWSKPSDWTGALAYGTYRIHEVIPQDVADAFKAKWGKTLLPVEDWKTTIREEGQYDPPQLVNDHIPQTPLKVVKVDTETGRQVPLPVSFQLEDASGNLVTYTSHYPATDTIDTWTANERGELTLPMLLEEGDYTLKEVEAPYGYAKHGTYHIQEVEAPEGYVIADLDDEGKPTVTDFVVNDQGMIEWDETGAMAAQHEFTLENMPKTMKTTATDSESGTHEGQARDELTIVDTIEYTGLIPGNEYTVSGTLMDKATGEPALDDEGDEITASTTFTAEESCGTVDVTFTFAGVNLAGKSLVAFETMEFGGAEYMVHADIDDVEQAVAIVDIATNARDAETGTNVGTIGERVKLIDAVAYTGLAPGSSYKLFTMLMDKATGNPLTGDDGLPIVGTTEFVPETLDGTIDVEVETDSRELTGHDIVFFEKLSDAEENIIATHEDIEDEGQTVSFPEPLTEPENPGKGYPKTGALAEVDPVTASVAVILLCGIAGATYAFVRRSRKQTDAIAEMEEGVLAGADED